MMSSSCPSTLSNADLLHCTARPAGPQREHDSGVCTHLNVLSALLTDTFFPMGRIAPLMVSRLILNLRGADDAQKNHMRLSGMGSDHSAKRGTLGACGFSPLDGETLTLLFVFLCLVPGPNQRHR